jgi:anti-sigma-K factor RskA
MTAEDRISAAELALGLLTDNEQASASARAAVDPDFAQEVEWWQHKLAPLYAHVDDVLPPSYLRDRIAARLEVPTLEERQGNPKWRLLGFGGAVGALAASIVAWMMSAETPVSTVSPLHAAVADRPLVASLLPIGKSEEPAVTVMLERDTGSLSLSAKIQAPAARNVQLWLIRGTATPVSLGVLSGTSGKAVRLQKADLPVVGDQLAASIEPLGGSPTGQPTGPVILSGKVTEI